MAVVVRYVCHHCGAAREGAGGGAWVRCDRCGVLVAFDWQAWFSSPAYAAYLREAMKLALRLIGEARLLLRR